MPYNSKQKEAAFIEFKETALTLFSYKMFRDYFDALSSEVKVCPERFFESWIACYIPTESVYSKEDKERIWKWFLKLLVMRSK